LTLKCTVGLVFIINGALQYLCMYVCMYVCIYACMLRPYHSALSPAA